jgi:hypothetical protein
VAQSDNELIKNRLNALALRPFRAKFHLGPKEKAIISEKSLATVREHGAELLRTRLFPAFPAKDGRQTPYRGHPVFVAQHATATCCRTCLARWHKIPKSEPLNETKQEYVLDVIETWILQDLK